MSSSKHRAALSAFEEDDPLVSGLNSKIANFQKKLKDKSKHDHDYYDWIHSGIVMNDAEVAATKQILQACSNVLELIQKEKDYGGHLKICDIDHSTRADELRSAMSVIQKPARDYSCKDNDIMSGISEVRHLIASVGEQINAGGESIDYHALCAKTLLDTRDALATLIEENDESFAKQSSDTSEHRRRAMLNLSHSLKDEFPHMLPAPLASALDSLRSLLQRNDHTDDGGEIDDLQHCLSIKFEEAPTDCDPNQQKLADLEKKCHAIEKDGLEEVERLRELFLARFQTTKADIETNLRRKGLKLKLMTLRHEREESQKSEAERQVQATAKKVGDDYQKELKRALRVLETKHAVLKHHADQSGVEQENCNARLKDDFADEIESRRRQQTNQTRSNLRKARIDSKNLAQRTTKEEAAKAEESRIERLNAISASVPYNRNKQSDIYKTTEARKHDVYAGPSTLADFQCGNLKSFTQEKVFSDPKFR